MNVGSDLGHEAGHERRPVRFLVVNVALGVWLRPEERPIQLVRSEVSVSESLDVFDTAVVQSLPCFVVDGAATIVSELIVMNRRRGMEKKVGESDDREANPSICIVGARNLKESQRKF